MEAAMNFRTALLDVHQMGEADRLSVAAGISVDVLMENAGKAVADEIMRRWAVRPVIVLCGPGNNGGDGFVTARHLSVGGWPVRIALLGQKDHLTGAARHHADLWRGPVEPLTPAALGGVELIVDANFGAGLSRALDGQPRQTLADAARRGIPIVAAQNRRAP
jgi:NAD(P)H-hydrate epimerase